MLDLLQVIAEDVAAYNGIPTSTIKKFIDNKRDTAREILLSEIRDGNFKNVDNDEFIGILLKYDRSVIEGVAKENLRLLAQMINGMIQTQSVRASLFLKYADVLATLSHEDLRILAIMIKFDHKDSSDRDVALKAVSSSPESGLQALIRTGLVMLLIQGLHDIGEGTKKYKLTPLMDEIRQYIDLSQFD